MSGTIKPICILDDDSSILSSLKELLASDGFEAETFGRPKGSVLTVLFQLDGEEFLALNGGPHFKFSPAISFIANCGTQKEIDELWKKLSEGGKPNNAAGSGTNSAFRGRSFPRTSAR